MVYLDPHVCQPFINLSDEVYDPKKESAPDAHPDSEKGSLTDILFDPKEECSTNVSFMFDFFFIKFSFEVATHERFLRNCLLKFSTTLLTTALVSCTFLIVAWIRHLR